MSELNKEHKLASLTMEELEALAGGAGEELADGSGKWWVCPKCGSDNLTILWTDYSEEKPFHFNCLDCNHFWASCGIKGYK